MGRSIRSFGILPWLNLQAKDWFVQILSQFFGKKQNSTFHDQALNPLTL